MRPMRAIFTLLGAALVVGSGASVGRAAPTPVSPLEFERVTKEKTVGDCTIGDDECAYVRLEYPVVVAAPEGCAAGAVTDADRAPYEGRDVDARVLAAKPV